MLNLTKFLLFFICCVGIANKAKYVKITLIVLSYLDIDRKNFMKDSNNSLFKNLITTLIIYAISILAGLWLSNYIKLKTSNSLELLLLGGFITLAATFTFMTFYHPNNIVKHT